VKFLDRYRRSMSNAVINVYGGTIECLKRIRHAAPGQSGQSAHSMEPILWTHGLQQLECRVLTEG
jgi:hypothetical protein